MDPEVVQNFLSEQREAAPEDLQQSFVDIEDYWDRKLWHQLTDLLITYFQDSASASQRLPLFRRFILSFAEKINQLKFVALGLSAATQCAGTPPHKDTTHIYSNQSADDNERLTFLTDLTEKVDKPSSQDAYVYSLVAAAAVKLTLHKYDGTRNDLDKGEKILESFDSVETEVHAAFYRTNASYYQVGYSSRIGLFEFR